MENSARRNSIIMYIVLGICLLAFISLCVILGTREQRRYKYLDQVISVEEMQLVQEAINTSGVTLEYDVRLYMEVLFDAVWYHGTESIDVVYAEVIPFVNDGLVTGQPIEGYAIKVMDDEGNEYIVWYSYDLQRVLKNGEDILFSHTYR